MQQWIWQNKSWTDFTWKAQVILPKTRQIYKKIGCLFGQHKYTLDKEKFVLDNLVINLVSSFAIENENINTFLLRPSLAHHLEFGNAQPYDNNGYEGLVSILVDILINTSSPLTFDRLMQWHQWLFNNLKGNLHNLRIGQLRDIGCMQVISGHSNNFKIHFEAPSSEGLEKHLNIFIDWFNYSKTDPLLDPIIRAGIAHFWLITLHSFEDGNGRIARFLTDLALAQMDLLNSHRFCRHSLVR